MLPVSVKMKNSLSCYVLLVLCVDAAFAQFIGQTPQFSNIDQRRQLSPQQQGHILSDIQQHHHRFGPQNQQFSPQHFSRHQQIVAQSGLFNQQQQQQFLNQQFQQPGFNQQNLLQQSAIAGQPNLQQQLINPSQLQQSPLQNQLLNQQQQFQQNQQFLNSQGFNNPSQNLANVLPSHQGPLPTPQIQQSSILSSSFINSQNSIPTSNPTLQTQNEPVLSTASSQVTFPTDSNSNRVLQHHTQTSFTPNFAQAKNLPSPLPTDSPQNLFFKPRPTADPVQAIEQQIQLLDPEKNKQKIKELREKQAIIEKHNQFVEKQYKKALEKAQADHQEFLEEQREQKKKLYQKLFKPPGTEFLTYSQNNPRLIYPEEAPLFKQALEKYYQEHPTTTTTTTTTTTPAPTTTKAKSKKKPAFLPTVVPSSATKAKAIQSLEDLEQLQKQYKSQQLKKDELLAQLRLAIGDSGDETAKNLASREISLANGKKVQFIETSDPKFVPNGKPEEITLPNGEKVLAIRAEAPSAPAIKPEEITLPTGQKVQIIKTTDPKLLLNSKPKESGVKTQEITLPNGEKVEIIKTTDPKLVPGATPLEPGSDLEKLVLSRTTTIKPPKAILEELTKGVVPSGGNFELLKTGASGSLEQLRGLPSNLPNQKKVTFVLLEEQSDGTLKVQGVKGNGKDKPEVDVDSILKKIKAGEIKLPSTTETPTTESSTVSDVSVVPNSFASDDEVPVLRTNIGTDFVSSSTSTTAFPDLYSTKDPSLYTSEEAANVPILKTNFLSSTSNPISYSKFSSTRGTTPRSTTTFRKTSRQPHIINNNRNDLVRQASTVSSLNQNSILSNTFSSTYFPKSTNFAQTTTTTTPEPTSTTAPSQANKEGELPEILKKHGLFAMAKFLRQSGLDTILNETGPYTIFIPTDKAFRTLLVQLGGPEKADEKFKENPRLLSGLLLHHVIPGAFNIGSLQDEMTGVSLAGTQLRVNQYNMHDLEWNDIKITTINGAKVLDEKKDIEIPQGIAHAVDRVMFPLPVGDIVQTLQSDRERRFTNFLRAIFASGLAETLQGTKTFTLFAPTDKAFQGLSDEDLNRSVSDRTLAKELVLRHLTPGTLYTNGMRYYQIRDSLLPDKQITLSKQSGKIKVNNIQLSTQNVPTTNGVIHAIDGLL